MPAKSLGSRLLHATTSSTTQEIPTSDNFVSTQLYSSVKDVCLTFAAIAPMACAAATLVSQFLLRRYCETWIHSKLASRERTDGQKKDKHKIDTVMSIFKRCRTWHTTHLGQIWNLYVHKLFYVTYMDHLFKR